MSQFYSVPSCLLSTNHRFSKLQEFSRGIKISTELSGGVVIHTNIANYCRCSVNSGYYGWKGCSGSLCVCLSLFWVRDIPRYTEWECINLTATLHEICVTASPSSVFTMIEVILLLRQPDCRALSLSAWLFYHSVHCTRSKASVSQQRWISLCRRVAGKWHVFEETVWQEAAGDGSSSC